MKNKKYSCTHGCKYSAVAMVNELGFTITFKHDIPIGQLTKDGMDFSTSDILVDENAFRFLDENSMSSFTDTLVLLQQYPSSGVTSVQFQHQNY